MARSVHIPFFVATHFTLRIANTYGQCGQGAAMPSLRIGMTMTFITVI